MSPVPPAPLRLFVDDGGPQGPLPVVFLHSAGGDGSHFADQLAHLRRTRRALAVDLPGHGRSPHGSSFAIDDVAADVMASLAARGLERFVLVGHSWGGAVAVAIAGRQPERVAGLLLLDPAGDGRLMPKEVADGLMGSLATNYEAVVAGYWASMLEGARPEVRDRLMREILGVPHDVVIGTLGSLLTFDPVTPLSRYSKPRRSVITRLNDRPDAYHRLVEGLSVTRVEGTGHWLQLDKPEEINKALDAFVAEVER